jgi:hypothetical protein
MNGARFVHDTLGRQGWEVEVVDAQKVKGLARLACKTVRIDAWVHAEFSRRDLVPAIWLPGFEQRGGRERPAHDIRAALPCSRATDFGQLGRRQGQRHGAWSMASLHRVVDHPQVVSRWRYRVVALAATA